MGQASSTGANKFVVPLIMACIGVTYFPGDGLNLEEAECLGVKWHVYHV